MAKSSPSDRYLAGMEVRRKVLGKAHVDRAESGKTDFDAPFQTLITEAAWGNVWARETWDTRLRSIVTLAILCAKGHWEEVEMHLRATANTGATREDVQELVLHVAIYAGVPAANHAMKLAKSVLDEVDL